MPGLLEGLGLLALAVLVAFLLTFVTIFGMAVYLLVSIVRNTVFNDEDSDPPFNGGGLW